MEVGAQRIALFNIDGTFYAIDDTCTHRGHRRFWYQRSAIKATAIATTVRIIQIHIGNEHATSGFGSPFALHAL